MTCPICEKEISFQEKICSGCGQDLTIYRRIISVSNHYYNEGLEKAKVRDLSGAVDSLKKSLRFNKKNTQARNLLGVIYYEMGEVVSALREWVLSKNFQVEDNPADDYMAAVQANATKLENINQTIKKYNSALGYAKQGSEDLAIMQLEKVVSLNPKFIRSHQLLALLYMKSGEERKAAKCLAKANSIDKNNTLTLKYMSELPDSLKGESKESSAIRRKLPEQDLSPQVFNTTTYKEDKVNIWPYLNLLIGAVLGIAVVYFLIVPTVKKNVVAQYQDQLKTYNDQMASQSITANQLTNENEQLKDQVESLTSEMDDLKMKASDENLYDSFFEAIDFYLEGEKDKAAEKLAEVKESDIDNPKAKEIYSIIKESTFIDAAEQLAEEGRNTYNSGKYEEAIVALEQALSMDSSNVKAIYFLGRSYHRLKEYDKAREYYSMIVNDYPDSDRVSDATRRLREIPAS